MALCFPSAPCLGLGIRNASCLHACLISIQSSFALAVCLSHQHTHSLALAVCLSRQHTSPHCLWFLLPAVPYQHTQSTFSNMLVSSACISISLAGCLSRQHPFFLAIGTFCLLPHISTQAAPGSMLVSSACHLLAACLPHQQASFLQYLGV